MKRTDETPESKLQRDIRAAFAHMPDLWCYRNNQGTFQVRPGEWHHFGLPKGSADLICSLRVRAFLANRPPHPPLDLARFVALETKSAAGKLTKEQRDWGRSVQVGGGFYAVVRSVAEAMAAIERARQGARQ